MAEMQQMRKVPPSVAKKKTEKVKEMPKVKITGTASTKPRVSTSMSKSQPATASKPKAPSTLSTGVKKPMPKMEGAKPSVKKPMPKVITKAPVKRKVQVMPDKISPSKMTPAQKARYLKNPERYDG